MTEYLLLLISTVLVNNFVLVKFLGLCPFMGVSKKLEPAIGMGLARDWDPSDQVYSDRRGDNDDLAFFDDVGANANQGSAYVFVRSGTIAWRAPWAGWGRGGRGL